MTEDAGVDDGGLGGLQVLLVLGRNGLEVVAKIKERLEVETRVSVGVLEGGDERLDCGLCRAQGQRRETGVDDVHTGFDCLEDGHRGHAARVVRVQLERYVDDFFQCRKEVEGVVGGEETRHVLYADAVGIEVEEFLRLVDVVVEVVDRTAEDALFGDGVADR